MMVAPQSRWVRSPSAALHAIVEPLRILESAVIQQDSKCVDPGRGYVLKSPSSRVCAIWVIAA